MPRHGIVATILGKQWPILFAKRLPTIDGEPTNGWSSSPDEKGKQILIREGLPPQKELETVIHEFTHCANWQKDEVFVHLFSRDLAEALTRLGWTKREDS